MPAPVFSAVEKLPVTNDSADTACARFLEELGNDYRVYCAKTHRVALADVVPSIPCLDHEAQLEGHADPHISVYLEDAEGDLHEVAIVPARHRIIIDEAATLAETAGRARERLAERLRAAFPGYRVDIKPPSVMRGDKRVAAIVRAQLRLREVLRGEDGPAIRAQLDKLRAIAELMEKESRVYSWSVRTMSPVLGGAGVASYIAIGMFKRVISIEEIEVLRSATVTVLTTAFLYYGLKAVYLTELGTRVWKRATEYRLILDARQRLAAERSASKR